VFRLKYKAKVPFGDLGVEANLEVFPKPSRFKELQKIKSKKQ
jgi:hypothetical protein